MTTSTAALPARPRPLWRRLIGFNLLTAIILGAVGFYVGWFVGNQIYGPSSTSRPQPTKTTSRCSWLTSSR